jgi:hypothetical protein
MADKATSRTRSACCFVAVRRKAQMAETARGQDHVTLAVMYYNVMRLSIAIKTD